MQAQYIGALILPAMLLMACGEDEHEHTSTPSATAAPTATQTPTPAVQNLIVDFPEPGEGAEQWHSPDYEVPAGAERQFCYFTTYDGPDRGIRVATEYQEPTYGHHAIMLRTYASEETFPDDTYIDCTDLDAVLMADMESLYIAAENPTPGIHEMRLPEGWATFLPSGARLLFQSHFVNYSTRPILVRDAITFEYLPEDDVETWVAAWTHTDIDLELPANASSSWSFNCEWDQDVYLLNAFGHMHEYGSSITWDLETDSGPDRKYEVAEWLPEYRDAFPVESWELDSFAVRAGDRFTTTCHWDNSTDHNMVFPEEMCAMAGLAYPAKLPLICEASGDK